jgi:integrase
MYENRLAIETSIATGLRISDVLSLKTAAVQRASQRRLTVKEMKTGKTRRVYFPCALYEELLKIAGRYFVFEHRLDPMKHRTRQTVWKDIRRAAVALRLHERVTPHTARKIYAVALYRRTGDIEKVARALKHTSQTVTMIYALADELTRRKHGETH